MPHIIGNIVVVEQNELIPLFWSSYDSLKRRLREDAKKGFGIKRFQRGGGKDTKLLINYDTLPKRIQQEIPDPRKADFILQKYYSVDANAETYYRDYKYPDGTYLVDETVSRLIINASVLQAVIKLEADRESERLLKGGSLRGVSKTLHADVMEAKEQLKHTLNRNYRMFKKQLNAFKVGGDDGYYSLITDPLGKRKKNAQKRTDDINTLLNNMFAGRKFKPTMAEVSDEYNAFIKGQLEVVNQNTSEIYNPEDFKHELDVRTIRSYLSSYSSKIGTYAKRSGDRQKLMVDFVPYETLEQPKFAGSMISIDDRQPPFKYDSQNRMWWYLGIDLASEAITAWAYGKTKEELIINFYRQLVRNYHEWNVQLPDALECELSLNSQFKSTFLQEGRMFQNVQIHPNSARSKRIEAYFKPLRYNIEKKQEGWIARPFANSEANQKSEDKIPVVRYDRLVEQCFGNIVKWNNMPNNQDKSISRFDYFKTHQHPNLKPTNYKSFIKYLGKPQQTSCKAGLTQLQYSEWLLGDDDEIYTGEKLIKLLELVEGKDFDVYWLDGNDGKVIKAYVYLKDRLICQLLPKPSAARAPIEREQHHVDAREIMARYRSTVTAYMAMQKSKIDPVTIIDHRKETISDTFTISRYKPYQPSVEPVEAFDEAPEDLVYNNNNHSRNWNDKFKI